MPKLSDSMEEATILRWLKRPGEPVRKGNPLVEVETDKATMIYEAEFNGTLDEIVVDEGGTVALGAVIARASSEAVSAPARVPERESDASRAQDETPVDVSSPEPVSAPAAAMRKETSELEFRDAIREALDEELARDESVILFGEDVALAGGVFAVTPGLYEKFGPGRVFDTPISELAMTGAAFGAAVTGKRPVLEIMFGDFLALSMDSLINQSTKYWFLTEERRSAPIVIRSVVGAGGRFGAIHSQMPISWLMGITGLKIVAPSNPADAKGLLKASIRDDNPVVFFEHKRLYSNKGPVPGDGAVVPLGKAAVVREGIDVTLVSAMKGVHDCLAAADLLAEQGVSAEVVDLRTLRPLDAAAILSSLAKTHRIAIVEEGPIFGGWAGEVLSIVTEAGLSDIDDAWRIATENTPIPYSPPLEDAFLPGPGRIAAEVLARR
jgi:pyruvate/2-oxoglutarate/acetoin dehydrogenase E1 component